MHQLNVKSASLNGPLDEEVYAIQVSGFEIFDQEEKVLRLKKALYGLKQAPRAWNKRFDNFLSQIGFVECTSEHGMCLKVLKMVIDTNLLIMYLYVDGLLATRSNEREIKDFKKKMMKEFEMGNLGSCPNFLELNSKQQRLIL